MTDPCIADLRALLPTLERLGQRRRLPRGAVLIEQGRHDRQMFYLESGRVEVRRSGAVINEIGPGDVVGEVAFIDNRPRTASVIALEDLEVIVLERDATVREGASDLGFLSRFLGVVAARMDARLHDEDAESVDAFLARLQAEALAHRAVNHPYLQALSTGSLPDLRWALADFGRQYYGYSAHFPRYLTKTISQLTDPSHREALMENLVEESGSYADEDLEALAGAGIEAEWILGVPHPDLFKRFCDALGVELSSVEEDQLEVVCWREMFLDVLGEGTPAQAVGALGLGTEGVVSTMYQHFLPALEKVELDPRAAVFFPLHAMVDDHHQETLLQIARDYAGTPAGRRDLRRGMRKALFLRAGFWDWMYRRALQPTQAA